MADSCTAFDGRPCVCWVREGACPHVVPPTDRVLAEVAAERRRQDERWGEQNHLNGAADEVRGWTWRECGAEWEEAARAVLADHPSWAAIFVEEIGESLQVLDDPAKLRAELLQVAAVAVAWVEALDRREVDRG